LLGTVIGILHAFQQIATQKTSGIGAVAGGISEALVTTAFGLLVAIPAVMTFNYFTGRVENFDVEMDNSSSELIDYFIKQATSANRLSVRARVFWGQRSDLSSARRFEPHAGQVLCSNAGSHPD